jgi:hypothetical protein
MSAEFVRATGNSGDPDSLVLGPTFEGLSTGNDSARYGVDSAAANTVESTWSSTGDTVSAELLTLQGRLDRNLVLARPIQAVRVQEADGYSIYQPLLGIAEFGESPAEALENLISYMVSDSTFLINAADQELAEDAQEQRRRYLQIIDLSRDQ